MSDPPLRVDATVLLATGNAHKVEEVQAILGPTSRSSVATRASRRPGRPSRRTRSSRRGAGRDATGELAVADDSGIEIDHLGGRPGVHSARWTEEGDWIPPVLRELDGVAGEDRGCRYVCAAAAVWPDGREEVVRGAVEGVIADEPRAPAGFGYDPIVQPVEGDGRTFAEMTPDEKHAISHRARAFRALRSGGLGGSPAAEVDVPDLDHLVAVDDVQALVLGHGRVDVGGDHPHGRRPPRVAPSASPNVMCSSDTNQQSPTSSTFGSPWSMPNALSPASSTPQRSFFEITVACTKRRSRSRTRAGVLGVHQAVGAGLELGDPPC